MGVRGLLDTAGPANRRGSGRRRRLSPDDPAFPHGKNTGYQQSCRCDACCEAHNVAAEAWRKRKNHMLWGSAKPHPEDRFPAWFVRDHVLALAERFTYSQIEALTGVTRGTLNRIARGDRRFVTRVTRDAVMAVPVDVERPSDLRFLPEYLPREWVEQMLGSLGALGYTKVWVQEQAKGFGDVPRSWFKPGQTRVTRGLYLAVKRVYDEVGDRPGPSYRTRVLAERAGWRVPGAYENHVLIPGAALVDAGSVGETAEDRQERRERIMRLFREGLDLDEVAQRMGMEVPRVRREREAYYSALARQRMTLEQEPGRMTG